MSDILLIISISAICVCSVFGFDNKPQRKAQNLSLSNEMPKNLMLAHMPTSLEKAREASIDTSVCNAEIAYTWYWLDLTLRWQWRSGANRSEAACLCNVGNTGDDAVVLSWSSQDVEFDIVDSRSLAVVIRPTGGLRDSTLSLFTKFIQFDYYDDQAKVDLELIGEAGDKESWGKFRVDRHSTGWYGSPIEWYRTENFLIFVFDKSLKPVFSRLPHKPEEIFGGANIDDPVPYLRFENSNRLKHSQKLFQQLPTAVPDYKKGDQGVSPLKWHQLQDGDVKRLLPQPLSPEEISVPK
jgi:hypothetical protein